MTVFNQYSDAKPASFYAGRKITAAAMVDNSFLLGFADGVTIKIWDSGQDCCERRYMRTDDVAADLIGRTLASIEVKRVETNSDNNGDPHEIAFMEINADGLIIAFSTHNEHNGYYGGFDLRIAEVTS